MLQFKRWVRRYLLRWLYRKALQPASYIALKEAIIAEGITQAQEATGNLFTYHGEDGIIQYLVHSIKDLNPIFVDIGAGDCVKGNCTTLAVHNGWRGLFVDADAFNIGTGSTFYAQVLPEGHKRLAFKKSFVRPDNVNALLTSCGIQGAIGLLSIDIDGNDYWIWEALERIQPSILVIEAKVEFGLQNVVVPFSNRNHYRFDSMYNGASVTALRNLGYQKGYTLVASNPQGYNLFFVKNELVRLPLFELDPEKVLSLPETRQSFYKDHFFESHQFIKPTGAS